MCSVLIFNSILHNVQVRNLCYMVSRREKLKLLQSKAQEQMFNLHVTLINQEVSAGESLFHHMHADFFSVLAES